MLDALPASLDFPEHDLRVVHAGVLPDVAFEKQDPWTLTHMRSIAPDGIPSDRASHTPWAERHQRGSYRLRHNSRLKLQVHRSATGIDTGCVYGGTLTAMVLDDRQPVPRDARERKGLFWSASMRASDTTLACPADVSRTYR